MANECNVELNIRRVLFGMSPDGIRSPRFYKCRDANPPNLIGRLLIFVLTPKFGNLPISGKFCAIEVACNFENLPFLFESSLFAGC